MTHSQKRLAIWGAGGHARVVAEAAVASGWIVPGLFDDAPGRNGDPWAVLGDYDALLEGLDDFQGVIVAIGNNAERLRLTRNIAAHGGRLATVIHPSAWLSPTSLIDGGTAILAGAIVGTGACLGRAVIVNTSASVDHDNRIGDGVHIAPGAHLAGGVTIGERSLIGLGAVVREGLTLGEDVTVGAGAAVVKPVPSGCTVVGVPARLLEA